MFALIMLLIARYCCCCIRHAMLLPVRHCCRYVLRAYFVAELRCTVARCNAVDATLRLIFR